MQPDLIAIYSPQPRSGKTSVAEYLARTYGYARISFADPLRAMVQSLLGWCGVPDETYERCLRGDLKEVKHRQGPLRGVATRRILQTLGTEWGRECISQTLWTDIALDRVRRHQEKGARVVIDDLRFANEHWAIRRAGGHTWYLSPPRREETHRMDSHASEGALCSPGYEWDATLANAGGVAALLSEVDRLLARPVRARASDSAFMYLGAGAENPGPASEPASEPARCDGCPGFAPECCEDYPT